MSIGVHDIRVEYYEKAKNTRAKFSWQKATTAFSSTNNQLGAGYVAEQNSGMSLTGFFEAIINFILGR